MRRIDADALKKALKQNCTPELCHDYKNAWCLACCPHNEFEDLIDEAPSVDAISNDEGYEMYGKGYLQGYERGKAEAIPKGEWIDHSEDYGYVECPVCEHLTTCEGNKDELHYCWYCGSKMGKGGAE